MRRIAEQHDVAGGPVLVGDAIEVEPVASAQVRAVGQQAVSFQIRREELFAKGERLRGVGRIEAVREPRLLGALDDKGAQLFVETVGMDGEPAVLGSLEDEGEGIERQRRSEPDEAAAAPVEARLEIAGKALAHAAVDAVGADEQIALARAASRRRRSPTESSARRRARCARCCRIASRCLREMPQKPCPPERIVRPWKKISISSQWAKACVISRCVGASATRKFSSVASEKTTPQPNVSRGRLRSNRRTGQVGLRAFRSIPRYSPAGPPPMQVTRIVSRLHFDESRRRIPLGYGTLDP